MLDGLAGSLSISTQPVITRNRRTLAGFAATIKPTAAVFWIAMLVYVCWRAESRREAVTAAATGLSSFLMPPAAAIFYLWRRGGLDSFWGIATELVPLHNRLLRVPDTYFLLHPFASSLLAVCLLWLIVTAIRFRSGTVCWSDAEALLLIGLLCGLFSFYIQRKALPYHRYPANGYLGLLACLGFCKSLKSLSASVSLRVAGATGLLFCTLIVGPQCFLKSLKLFSTPDDFSGLLQNDLEVLGGPVLDHKIQCIDFTAGCVTTLYRMKLQQSTGFLYDCYLFRPEPDAVVHRYRSDFWQNLVAANPEVIVLSNHDCSHPNSFGKIYRWPLFASYLGEQYSLLKEVHPPHPLQWASKAQLPYFYRIYVRNAR